MNKHQTTRLWFYIILAMFIMYCNGCTTRPDLDIYVEAWGDTGTGHNGTQTDYPNVLVCDR